MGVFDFVKTGTEEMRLARASRDPIWVHPDATLPLWGQLVVDDDDAAVFVNGGRAVGIVGPGRHALHPSKLPFLDAFIDAAGRLSVQLVFVKLSPIERAKFSGALDPIADPAALSAITPLLEGELSVQVIDPLAFVEEHLSGGSSKPILARRGVIATIDGVRLAVDGRRIAVFAGAQFRRPTEPRPSQAPEKSVAMACRACGEMGEAGKFCAGCGGLVTDREQCVACRAELRSGARFCAACGVRVAPTRA